jgi:hypothetical protein
MRMRDEREDSMRKGILVAVALATILLSSCHGPGDSVRSAVYVRKDDPKQALTIKSQPSYKYKFSLSKLGGGTYSFKNGTQLVEGTFSAALPDKYDGKTVTIFSFKPKQGEVWELNLDAEENLRDAQGHEWTLKEDL